MNTPAKLLGAVVIVIALIVVLFSTGQSIWGVGFDKGESKTNQQNKLAECVQDNPSKTYSECRDEIKSGGAGG